MIIFKNKLKQTEVTKILQLLPTFALNTLAATSTAARPKPAGPADIKTRSLSFNVVNLEKVYKAVECP